MICLVGGRTWNLVLPTGEIGYLRRIRDVKLAPSSRLQSLLLLQRRGATISLEQPEDVVAVISHDDQPLIPLLLLVSSSSAFTTLKEGNYKFLI